jgi:hypothetical protein
MFVLLFHLRSSSYICCTANIAEITKINKEDLDVCSTALLQSVAIGYPDDVSIEEHR